jgi:hypothetical protein
MFPHVRTIIEIIKFQFQSARSSAAARQMALASGAHFLPTERLHGRSNKKREEKRRRRRRERERNEMGHCVVVVRALLMAWLGSSHRSLLLCSRRNLSAKETTKKTNADRESFVSWGPDYRPSENVD